jgi:hypothetical protein
VSARLRLYEKGLPGGEAELSRALGDSQVTHWNVIVDLDDIDAMSLAFPARSIWLISEIEPKEFFQRRSEEEIAQDRRLKVIHAAAGWTSREQLARQLS